MQKVKKILPWIFVILSAIGLYDALFLTIKHYTKSPLKCSLFSGCDVVTTSRYSMIFNIPIALLGALYYIAIGALFTVFLLRKDKRVVNIAAILTAAGFLTSFSLIYLQVFVIGALCIYCIISAVISTLLFVTIMIYMSKGYV